VVEDRPEVRALVGATLVDAGYAVTLAADGLEALALESNGPVDLVVSDIVMPRMGGIELVRVLREKRPSLRAVFLSGHPGELGTLPARAELLRKPFRAAELLAAVRDQLGGR
jgi:CheY-like chemotaxis protein